jgi:hypothetical protein
MSWEDVKKIEALGMGLNVAVNYAGGTTDQARIRLTSRRGQVLETAVFETALDFLVGLR